MSIEERLHRLATKLCMTPGSGLRIERDRRDSRWWLLGCVEGDTVLPMAKGAPSAERAMRIAEKWLDLDRPSLDDVEDE